MNNKKVPRKKTSAIFLAIVLVMGTFAAISPLFIIGVSAQSESYNYGMDDRYSDYEQEYEMNSYDKKSYEQESYGKEKDKSKDSRSDLLKKIKCNNINANLNNVDANFGSPSVEDGDTTSTNGGADGEALSAQGGESISANGLMNGASNGDRNFVDRENDFAFVCINNNNNTVIEEPISELCEECFAANSRLQTAILDFLVEFDGVTTSTFFSEDGIGEIFFTGTETNTIEQLCAQIENAVEQLGVPLSDEVLEQFFTFVLGEGFEAEIEALIECLLEAGLIVDREPPPDSLSANGIAGANVQCTGDPLCARLQ